MAETTREMVVRLTMDAGGFKKTASEIDRQIKNIDKEIKGMGNDPSKSKLEEKLGLQKKAVENLKGAVDEARKNFDSASTAADKLAKASSLSSLESQLASAETKAANLVKQLSAANMIKFGTLATNFGKSMSQMGRSMSMYVSGPLMALGGKAYKTALDFESATVSMKKTIDETDTTKYADIEAAFKSISETSPVGYTELMELAGQAGALGVSADQVVEFVKSIAMISETADDLDASTGADVLARFLNVTDQGSFENITRTASAVTALGNGLATTEGELLAMAQRMASTGELAGMSNESILALAAGLTSVGINAEAGGSAAGKLMKQMQLAGETGSRAMQEFSTYSETAGLSARDLQLAADNSKWVEKTAVNLGRTKKEVKDMIGSMVALEQFSGVMNVTPAQFIDGWNANAGQSVLDFFIGLNEIEASNGEESVLSKLQEMGLTEIRLSNMISAAAANPDLFARAMEISNQAYEQNTALAEEAEKRYATAESRQRVKLNTMENAAADAGENLVDPIQNVMTKITDMLGKFGELDEGTQDWILGIGGGLAVGGPALLGLGKVIEMVGNITTSIGKAKQSTGALQALMSNPALWGVVAGVGGIALLISALESIESPSERIVNNLKNIKVELDEESYNSTVKALAAVRAQSDALAGETGKHNKNISAAVKAGYGTSDMYGTALGYESAFTQNQISDIAGKYSERIDELNGAIGAETDKAKQAGLAQQRDNLKAQWETETTAAKNVYMDQVSALVSGMMQGQPEAKAALEQAAKDYDLLALLENTITQVMASDDQSAIDALWAGLFSQNTLNKYFNGQKIENIVPSTAVDLLRQSLVTSLSGSLSTAGGDNSLAYSLWQSILADPVAANLFDQTKTQGALDGIIELMDFKNAGGQAGVDFGTALTPGLSDAITESIPGVSGAMDAMQGQLVGQATKMAEAITSAFNNNLKFNLPNATGGGQVNVNVGSTSGATGIYQIRRELNNANNRTRRGYGNG